VSFQTEPPRYLTAEDIWSCQDIEERDVYVPAWHGTVTIRTFSKRQVDDMVRAATVTDRFGKESLDKERLEAQMFCAGLIRPKIEPEQYDRLKDEKSAAAIAIISNAIIAASGLSELALNEAAKSPAARSIPANGISLGARIGDDAGGAVATDVGE